MYIESQPLPVHGPPGLPTDVSATDWFHRPSVTSKQSSSSSLRGMERTAPPSFQDFVKRTPPVGAQKPLPPIPLIEQCTSTELPTTRPRRTSSVYSRTISHWAPTPESWRRQDIVASDMFLQPSMYSLSTPELVLEEQPEPQGVTTLLQPRTYAPLLASPSPSPSPSFLGTPLSEASADVFGSSFEDHCPSVLLPAAERSALLSSQHVKTTSLDKPRVTALHKTRSLEDLGTVKATKTSPPPLPSLSQTVARWRESGSAYSGSPTTYFESSPTYSAYSPVSTDDHSIVQPSTYDPLQMPGHSAIDMSADTSSRAAAQPSSWTEPSFEKFRSRESKLSDKYFGVDPIDRAAMAPVARQQLLQDHRIAMETSLVRRRTPVEEDYEDRGRSRQSLKHSQHNQSHSTIDQRNEALIFEADRLAKEYHNLLPERDDEQARRTHRTSYDGRDVKLAPQPLFFNPRQVSKQRIEQYNRQRIGSILTSRPPGRRLERAPPATRWRNNSPTPRPPLKLSLTPDSTRSQSTSGSIPISSPMSIKRRAETAESLRPQNRTKDSRFPIVLTHVQNKQHFEQQVRQRSSIDDSNGFSSFYPRKDSYAAAYSLGLKNTVAADLPPITSPHGATIVATRAEAEAAFNQPSEIPIVRPANHKHNTSDGSSTQRAVKKPLAQVGEKVASLTNVFHRSPYKSTSGLSSLAPGTSDALHAPRPPKLIITSHRAPIISKPMPIIEGGMGMMKEPSLLAQTHHKRPSLFAHFSDSRRESKAEKRRTELKKSIRLVPATVTESSILQQKGTGGAPEWV